jgi:dihydrofolate synthase/folylpolyglutamate synthase
LVPAPLGELVPLAEAHLAIAEKHRLTYFEFLTLLCFVWATQKKLDYLVLEVGMGGRLDATNVTTPLATAITTLDWDHEKYLGHSLEAILTEKMGILRPHTPVFSAIRSPSLMALLESRCRALGSELFYSWKIPQLCQSANWEGQDARIDGNVFHLRNPSAAFLENASLAYSLLRRIFPSVSTETIAIAFSKTANPGRLETVQTKPRVVLSGDHNLAGVESLVHTLQTLQTRPKILCGFSPDKPHQALVERLRSVASDLLLTQVPRFESAMPSGYRELASFDPDPQHAYQTMVNRCTPEDTLVVTGSLYLVGELRPLFKDADRGRA